MRGGSKREGKGEDVEGLDSSKNFGVDPLCTQKYIQKLADL